MEMRSVKCYKSSVFDRIPVEILIHIFRFCKSHTSFFCVNKTWNWCAERVFDPSVNNNEAICYASLQGSIESVKKLLKDKRVDSAVNNERPIQWAIGSGEGTLCK